MVNNIHSRLKHARIRAGYKSARQFALQNGLIENTYRSHESGERGVKQPEAEKYALLLNVDLYWLLTGGDNTQTDCPVAANPGMADSSAGTGWQALRHPGSVRKIPVLGYAADDNEKNTIHWDYDAPIAWVDAPSQLAGVVKASALRYTGDNMYPRYKDGDILIINRAVMPKPDQDCVFDSVSGGTHVMTFLRQDREYFYFQQYNPKKELRFAKREIAGIYAVACRTGL